MDVIEKTETVGGAGLLGVPAFDFFVWALDTYGRGGLLMSLHEHLPPLLLNPGVGFVCLCGGLGLLYMSHKRQVLSLREQSAKRLVDYSGTEVQTTSKPNWLIPVIAVFLLALIATPILAVRYSLAYTGTQPKGFPPPSPPEFAYHIPMLPHEKERPSRSSITINAPNGIGIAGGNVINPTVNNYGAVPPPDPETMTYVLKHHQHEGQYASWTEIDVSHSTELSQPMFLITCDQPILFFSFGLLDDGIVGTVGINGIHTSLPSEYWRATGITLPDPIHPEHAIQANVYNNVSTNCRAYFLSNKPIHGQRIIPIRNAP